MQTIGIVGIGFGIIIVPLIICGVSGFYGWKLLEDKGWFWRLHKDSKIRQTIITVILATIGSPLVWGFLIVGTILLVAVDTYELVRYGHTYDLD